MKELKDCPITFPYGATSFPYSKFKPHHGEDRAPEVDEEVLVKCNKLKLGLMGSTGFVFGKHTHVDKYRHSDGNPDAKWYMVRRTYFDPKGWSTIKGTVVYAGWLGTAGKCVIIRTDNNTYYRFLHLKSVVTSKGKKTY